MNKKVIYFFAFIGLMAGSFVPMLWGGSLLGGWSVLLSMVGGFFGIWVGAVLSRRFG